MDVNLLGDEEFEPTTNLPPVLQPQRPGVAESPDTAGLARLDIATSDSPSDRTGNGPSDSTTASLCASDSMHEADDFGDFLHSETVDNVWPHPEQPLSDGDHDQHGKLDTSQQPAPLAGSGIDSTPDSATDELAPCTSGADSAGPRGEKHDPINIAASQLLEWISGPGVPEDRDTTGPDAGPLPGADALAAWASAEGLMGGSDLTLHLGEIASRLCSIVPPWPQHVEPADMDQKPITVSLEPVYNTLGPATVVDAVRTSTDGTRLNTLAYNLVWPMYADHGPQETCTSEDDGLVSAYMRLAEKLSRP